MIKRILVAYDGSEHAERALKLAIDLAQQYAAEMQLLTVVPPLFLPTQSMALATSKLVDEANKQLENVFFDTLQKAEKKVKQEKPKLKVSVKFEHGRPEEKIVETAKSENFDIIVMGSRGLGRADYPLGSVSIKVADCAGCPVLIVK